MPHPVRRADLVTASSGDELAIHDPANGHFHTLNASASLVWSTCDGMRDAGRIAHDTGLPRTHVDLALSQLADAQLLVDPLAIARVNRRDVVRSLATAGALGIVALPLVGSITRADRAAAASCVPAIPPGGECLPFDTTTTAGCEIGCCGDFYHVNQQVTFGGEHWVCNCLNFGEVLVSDPGGPVTAPCCGGGSVPAGSLDQFCGA